MPTIPIIQKNVQQAGAPTNTLGTRLNTPQLSLPQLNPNAGAIAGQAQQRLARTVLYETARLHDEATKRANQVALMGAERQLIEFESAEQDEAFQRRGSEAFTVADDYTARYDVFSTEIHDNLANDDQKLAFQQFAQRRRNQYRNRLTNYQRQEQESYAKAEASAAVDTYGRLAWTSYNDPHMVNENIDQAKNITRTFLQGRGAPVSVVEKAIFEVENKLHLGVLQRVMTASPQKALDSLKAGNYDNVLNPDQLFKMTRAAERQVKAVRGHYIAKQKNRAKNAIAFAEVTGNAPPPDIAENLGRYAGEEAKEDFLTAIISARQTHAAVTEMQQLSLPDQQEAIAAAKMDTESSPDDFIENQARLQKMVRAAQQVNKELLSDPAGTAMKYAPFPIAEDDYESVLAEQERRGLPEIYRAVVPKTLAKQHVAELQAATDPTDIKQRVLSLRDRYGEHYPRAMQDLQDAGLGTGYGMIAFMNPLLDAEQMDVAASVVNTDAKELKKLAGSENYASIRDQVQAQVGDYFESLAGSGVVSAESLTEISGMVEKMALQYMVSGRKSSPSDAVERALLPITSKFNFESIDGRMARIPAEYNSGDIEDALNTERNALIEGQLIFHEGVSQPGQPPEPGKLDYDTFIDLLDSDARWVNLPDDSGMALTYNNTAVAERVDGVVQPVIRKFDDLANASQEVRERRRKLIDESLKKQENQPNNLMALPEIALP